VNLTEYDYRLPDELIAQTPAGERDSSRLMVLDLPDDETRHRRFSDLPELLGPDDLLVVNDTRVFPARLVGVKETTGAEIEIFLLRPNGSETWEALCRPAKRVRIGTRITFDGGVLNVEVVGKRDNGGVTVRLESALPTDAAIDAVGRTPLPPYIRREAVAEDRERYQTVYARTRGSVAAPTAGLHFTESLLEQIRSAGVKTASVTLHVGLGTFRPLDEQTVARDTLHREFCTVPAETAEALERCRSAGGRIVAVGTTASRALETAAVDGSFAPFEGWTDIFIKPPYRFRSVDCLITNFHLPRSSLLMLVSAFAGRERILGAYREAVERRYRFYSYGDAMFIIGRKR